MAYSYCMSFLILLVAAIFTASLSDAQASHWVGTWSASPQLVETRNLPPRPGLASNTLREVIQVSIGGKRLRVSFSNLFGSSPVTINSAHIALSARHSAIEPGTDRTLRFHGRPSLTIPAGSSAFSDAFDFDLDPLSDVAVTTYFGACSVDVTGHPGSRTISYLQAGDQVSAEILPAAVKTTHWYILEGLDVEASHSTAALVILGDSITDGKGSGTDKNDRWPDDLSRRLQAGKATARVAVLNAGIGGNSVLRAGLGPTALSRFDHDVLSQSGVRWLIVFEGVNDIGTSRDTNAPAEASHLIAAYQHFIRQAHAHHIRVYGATITPFGGSFYDTPAHEAARQTVNQWIRTGGDFDAVIDFDAILRNRKDPGHLLPEADSGDHLHPNEHGYHTMPDAIDLRLFEN